MEMIIVTGTGNQQHMQEDFNWNSQNISEEGVIIIERLLLKKE